MAQTRVWTCDKDNVVRRRDDGSGGQGSGGSIRLYVGRDSGLSADDRRNYDSFLRFFQDWTGVGKIVSAIATVYTDDGGGLFPLPSASDTPRVTFKRLLEAFSDGSNADGVFDAGDFTTAKSTTSDQRTASMQKAANLVTNIDVTHIIEDMAPKTVKRRDGTPGGGLVNHGFALKGTSVVAEGWSGWSRNVSDPAKRPIITLTYELGPTNPDTPFNLSPVGSVASIGSFQGDFTDPRPTDYLARTLVQVYKPSQIKTGTGTASNNNVTVTAHGWKAGQEVWFHSLTPASGTGLSTNTRYYVKQPNANAFLVATTPGGPTIDIVANLSALTVAAPAWSADKAATETERINARFNVVPDSLVIPVNTSHQWRARVTDQEGRTSAWTSVTAFTVTNTDPNAPTITPANASSYSTLTGVAFRGGFSDPDAGDRLLAYQVQLSAYPAADAHWDDANFVLWDTGKRYVGNGDATWETDYTGRDLAAGTYYWRARVWDQDDGVSLWSTNQIILTDDFDADPGSQTTLQVDPHAPWRVVIREMAYVGVKSVTGSAATDIITTSGAAHGLAVGRKVRFAGLLGGAGLLDGVDYFIQAVPTTTQIKVAATYGGAAINFTTDITGGTLQAITGRGPGNVVAVIENAKSIGASIMYNSPGEMHFTLPVDHPQIAVIEPKQTHYSIQFYGGDGWREVYAGLVDDFDATEESVVFLGIDYLGLLDYTMDERYFPSDPNRAFSKGGSYYSNQTIRTVVIDQLTKVAKVTNSPVGFITVGSIATMDEKVSIYSTMQPILGFIGGLLDSHRQGGGKKTRIQVRRTTVGGYEFVITDDPGQTRDNLRLRYGELVQGYRVIPFGRNWASVLNAIGRTREGIRVLYKTKAAPGIDPNVWGRFARAVIMDNVSDELDLDRRAKQAAIHQGKLGSQIGLGIRTGLLQPLNGYDICDTFPVAIIHGAVNTTKFGSGNWVLYGVTWEAGDDASQIVTLTLLPRDDATAPSTDLIDAKPISPQPEWQVGWSPPDPLKATSKYWLDQSTGQVYRRDDDTFTLIAITGSVTT